MSATKQDQARRKSVRLEVEVPGTPEEVWQTIATGPGITSWLFPTEVEERPDGAIAFHMGEGMDSHGTVTAWEPPGRFAYEEHAWASGAPPLATEFTVEARSGGTCTVRVVHSLFASGGDWDDELSGFESGWPPFFRLLQLYLAHFRGQRAAALRIMGASAVPVPEAFASLTGLLGLDGAAVGRTCRTSGVSTPPLAGTVERLGSTGRGRDLVLRLDEPAPGTALLGAHAWGGRVFVSVHLYVFAPGGREVVSREEPRWRAWMQERFPS